MKHLPIILAAVLVAGITLAAGIMHGRISERWGTAHDMAELGRKLRDIPKEFDGWRMTLDEELGENPASQLKAAGSIIRVYENPRVGRVRIALVLGPCGPMSVHIAEVCLRGRDYREAEERQRITIQLADGTEAEMWNVVMVSGQVEGDRQRVCYGWSKGDTWHAPNSPRIQLAGNPYLYKLDVSTQVGLLESDEGADPCREFLEDLLPKLKPYLVPPSTE